ncbi:peptidylprolyl isomerase [Nitrosophilus kaiyonis]|uniref:peptidylprolyl isomerase n=1 Tax=Nitrosophilus kaiyonis TaxID=2930200 RepID=UPI0024908DFF|nr:peptidylprolyl isomerase [Nitrosophilus kaiyonis]
MISWMQKHKKWLVITIWISTIAFVGAGFVGWGAYQYGSSAGAVAKVGDIKITTKELSQRYANIYSYYNNLFKGNFDQKKAKELGLEKEALKSLITEALYLNLAKELGIKVLEDEVANTIFSMEEFQKNGKFDKKLYIEVLKRAGLKPKDFEKSIEKEILLSKLQNILKPVLTPLEFETFGSSLFMSDKIKYKVLTANDINISYNENDLKNFWEKNKKNYMTQPKFKLSLLWVEPKNIKIDEKELKEFYTKNRNRFVDENGKIKSFENAKEEVKKALILKKTKKIALKKYIQFKKGKIKESEKLELELTNNIFPSNIMQEISQKNEKYVLKPKLIKEKYVIIRLDEKVPSRPKSFLEAKNEVVRDFIKYKKREKLLSLAKKMYKNFDGKITDFISRDDIDKIPPLEEVEAAEFLNKLFASQKNNNFIELDNQKIVLYKILDQKLVNKTKLDKNKDFITDNSIKVKSSLLNSNLLDALQKRYNIEIFYKGQ